LTASSTPITPMPSGTAAGASDGIAEVMAVGPDEIETATVST
jgi:hypothetical protein